MVTYLVYTQRQNWAIGSPCLEKGQSNLATLTPHLPPMRLSRRRFKDWDSSVMDEAPGEVLAETSHTATYLSLGALDFEGKIKDTMAR